MPKQIFLKEYDFNLTPGGVQVILTTGEYFRIQSSAGGVSISIDGVGELPGLLAGQGIKSTPFKRLTLRDVSGAANAGKLLVSSDEFIDNRTYGVNSLDAATIASLKLPTPRPEAQTGFFSDVSARAANSALEVFSPAANVNGAILLSAQISLFELTTPGNRPAQAFMTKNGVPATKVDGSILLMAQMVMLNSAASAYAMNGALLAPQTIASGQGLYFFSEQSTGADTATFRACRYKLL